MKTCYPANAQLSFAMRHLYLLTLSICLLLHFLALSLHAQQASPMEAPSERAERNEPHVALLDMQMMILPGSASYLRKGIAHAEDQGAKLLIVRLDTPGGLLDSTQHMVQDILASKVPVVVYVSPSGGSATSAGVFITLAAHVAAMAPSTSIGSAHPVQGDGKDIEGDMRQKAENMTAALVRAISERRGRNVAWAEKAVKESSSLTEQEALKEKAIDFVAEDIDGLLRQIKGMRVQLAAGQELQLEDYTQLPRRSFEIDFRDRSLNTLANPNVAALLWLGATTGLSIELYNPGAILPGVVGLICLILALAVSQVIPINMSAVLLLALGALMIGLELFVPSGILAVGGIVAMVLGTLWLIDTTQAPGMQIAFELILPLALILSGMMAWAIALLVRVRRNPVSTGREAMVGAKGEVLEPVSETGKVYVNGEIWNARCSTGLLPKGQTVKVTRMLSGMLLEVEKT
jgi:membrane-bound serine protease (ClpP class)